jgi:methionine aminotransferase
MSSENKYRQPEGSLISFFSNKVKQYGGINLAQGIPGYSPPAELLEILSEISLRKDIHQYAPGTGNKRLVEQICKHYGITKCSPDTLLIVQGATEAITLLYIYLKKITHGGFSVLAFDPVYETYNNLPAIFGDKFISQPYTKDNQIDFEQLEYNIENNEIKLMFLNSPGNPYGRTFTQEEIDKVSELSEKYRFYIIADAVYRDLYFSQPPIIPYFDRNDRIFYVNSFSKSLSITGWRIGYLICSENHMAKIRSVHDYTGLSVSSVLQEAVATYLEKHLYGKTYTEEVRQKLIAAYQQYKPALEMMGFDVPDSEGGYFIWARLPEQYFDDFRFAIDLYEEKKVAIIPGRHFSPSRKDYVRFNIAREKDELDRGLEKIREFTANK